MFALKGFRTDSALGCQRQLLTIALSVSVILGLFVATDTTSSSAATTAESAAISWRGCKTKSFSDQSGPVWIKATVKWCWRKSTSKSKKQRRVYPIEVYKADARCTRGISTTGNWTGWKLSGKKAYCSHKRIANGCWRVNANASARLVAPLEVDGVKVNPVTRTVRMVIEMNGNGGTLLEHPVGC